MSVARHNNSTFSGGDVITLCGTISSQVIIPSSGSDNNNRITYTSYGSNPAILITPKSGAALYGEHKSYLIIDGIEVKVIWSIYVDYGISFVNGCHYITIKNNTVHDVKKGIFITSSTSQRNSYITIGGAYGDGNTVYNCVGDSPTGSADLNLALIDDLVVSYNKLYGEGSSGIDGVAATVCDKVLRESNNLYGHMYDSGEDGIDLKGSTNVIVRKNYIKGNKSIGINVNRADAYTHTLIMFGSMAIG